MQKEYKHGLVLGKFMPLHTGHMHLIDTAQNACEKLTILLFSQTDDSIPGETRLSWIKESFPEANLIHHTEVLPRDDGEYKHWNTWLQSIKNHTKDKHFDVIFSSEEYGERLANELGCTHITVDKDRVTHPISGTDIRKNPEKHRHHLPEHVRVYFNN